jgi:hypothetical protein
MEKAKAMGMVGAEERRFDFVRRQRGEGSKQ